MLTSVLNESQQLFAAKYMTYMPIEEELHKEIEQQNTSFWSITKKNNEYTNI